MFVGAYAFSNDIVEAAWDAGIGVHALIWASIHMIHQNE